VVKTIIWTRQGIECGPIGVPTMSAMSTKFTTRYSGIYPLDLGGHSGQNGHCDNLPKRMTSEWLVSSAQSLPSWMPNPSVHKVHHGGQNAALRQMYQHELDDSYDCRHDSTPPFHFV